MYVYTYIHGLILMCFLFFSRPAVAVRESPRLRATKAPSLPPAAAAALEPIDESGGERRTRARRN